MLEDDASSKLFSGSLVSNRLVFRRLAEKKLGELTRRELQRMLESLTTVQWNMRMETFLLSR